MLRRWKTATKTQGDVRDMYRKLQSFHGTLQRAAMRRFDERDIREATGTALKGYALISTITSRGAALRQALHAYAVGAASGVQGTRHAVHACRFGAAGLDGKSLESFADDLADARQMLAYSGIFHLDDRLNEQMQVRLQFCRN